MHASVRWLSGLAMSLGAVGASACSVSTGEREQRVFAEWNGRSISDWAVVSDAVHKIDLPNAFQLGVSVEPATSYEEARSAFRHVPELVKITLFDMSTEPPRRLTTTWGGANSIQGYGASGGADRVVELGDPGITLIFQKPVCATSTAAVTAGTSATGS